MVEVNGGSVAATAGLQAGDAIVSIGGKDALSLRHKEAQEAIVKAGNSFDLIVQRGAQTWRPAVTPLAQVKTTPEGVPVATSTSLAANKKPVRYIGSNHNSVARPFPGFTGSQPAYTPGARTLKSPLQEASDGPLSAPLSGTSSRSTSGSTSPSGGIPITTSTTISLNKENAKNFLKMTLDKENVNTINVHSPYKNQKTNSNENLFTSQFLNNNGASSGTGGHQRKYSLASNASSCSSDPDHDALTRRNNEYVAPVGAAHNTVALPFAEVNGQQIVNAQYNTPLNLYSEDNIAETLSAQAEVLGKGCLGINFKKYARETVIQTESPTYKLIHGDGDDAPKKPRPPPVSSFDKEAQAPAPTFPRPKPASRPAPATPAQPPQQGGNVNFMKNERAYDGKTSDVLRMVQEMDKCPVQENEDGPLIGDGPGPAGTRSVRAPQTSVKPEGASGPSQSTKCSECERPIIGVFVRIKNKNLHADCFKCSTCGSSLKNVGYYNINEKLYCDVHAKQAARHNPPGPNLEPVLVKPGAPVPSGAMPAPVSKVGPPPVPAPAPVPAPVPVQAPAAPMAAPPPTFTPFKAPAAPATQKVPFGAPAGSVDVRSHIPKKGVPFVWPPPKKVDTVEEGPRSPAWAPAGEPVYVPRPKHAAGPPPKRPPLLPTPPPPKDYDTMVIKASPPTQQPAEPAKVSPASASASAPAPVHPPAPAPAPAPTPAPAITPACKIPSLSGKGKIEPPSFVPVTAPMPTVSKCAPTPQLSSTMPAAPKPIVPKPAATAKPAASKPIQGFKSVAAPKVVPKVASSNVGFKSVSSPGQKTGPAPGAPSRLASAPIPPPISVPIVNSAPAPAPKPAPGPAAASASAPMPKPAAPKPPAPTGPAPAPVFAPAPVPAPVPAPFGGGMPKPTPMPDLGGSSLKGVAQTGGQRSAPRRGRGVMNPSTTTRIPVCADCTRQIRGPFVSALGKTWCPDHFVCSTESCRRALIDMGFVEEQGSLHCEDCYEKYFAPICGKCDKRVKGDCLNAVGKQFHPECFCCAYCGKVFGSGAFYLEDGLPYCEADWNDLFTTKCVGCGFPIEAGDRWVEALNNNYHSQCFKCSVCKSNLEGKSFYAKNGRPFCKSHAGR
ncbi:PDZ and LIM domain protein Zasp-like [Homarus americanus]|uniref:PDZ and LIM domain protein Zasp-like n=1 Tax=Homarus americanus TaxID=6706 RepID=A0A8J5NC78_HOMAM|nr:PDZ and LIM domain protein Zasp-like [Homarus americanus]